MRLYRGLKERYRPERVGAETNFTDCPYAALQFAAARRGVVLVIDVSDENDDVDEALWLRDDARRYIISGRFDDHLVATLEAKVLRSELKARGMSKLSITDGERSRMLRRSIAEMLEQLPMPQLARAVW